MWYDGFDYIFHHVNCHKTYVKMFASKESLLRSFGDIENFNVNEDFFVPLSKPCNKLQMKTSHYNFQTNFVEKDSLTQIVYHFFCLIKSGDIQSNNQPFPRRNSFG